MIYQRQNLKSEEHAILSLWLCRGAPGPGLVYGVSPTLGHFQYSIP